MVSSVSEWLGSEGTISRSIRLNSSNGAKDSMSATIVKTLRRVGLGSFTGATLYIFMATSAVALIVGYSSLFTLGTGDWAWFTLGNSPAWFTLNNNPLSVLAPIYTAVHIILPIAIGLIIAAWEIIYILESKEVNWTLAFTVAMFGIFAIIMSQVIWSVL